MADRTLEEATDENRWQDEERWGRRVRQCLLLILGFMFGAAFGDAWSNTGRFYFDKWIYPSSYSTTPVLYRPMLVTGNGLNITQGGNSVYYTPGRNMIRESSVSSINSRCSYVWWPAPLDGELDW